MIAGSVAVNPGFDYHFQLQLILVQKNILIAGLIHFSIESLQLTRKKIWDSCR